MVDMCYALTPLVQLCCHALQLLSRVCKRAGDAAISTLNISANNIGDKGAAALAEMLKSNTTLERLDLSSNVIDYDGITAISAALVDNTSLKALYVRCVRMRHPHSCSKLFEKLCGPTSTLCPGDCSTPARTFRLHLSHSLLVPNGGF